MLCLIAFLLHLTERRRDVYPSRLGELTLLAISDDPFERSLQIAHGDCPVVRCDDSPVSYRTAHVRTALRRAIRTVSCGNVRSVLLAVDGANASLGENGRPYARLVTQPHLLSTDARTLLLPWARSRGFSLPPYSFFEEWHIRLMDLLGEYTKVEPFELNFSEFARGIRAQAMAHAEADTVMVSLDRDLIPYPLHRIECTRLRDARTLKNLGEGARPGEATLDEQINMLASTIPPRMGIHLVTDGCWTCSEILLVAEKLRRKRRRVAFVTTGILTSAAQADLRWSGIPFASAFPFLHLRRWVCERDYVIGVPRSGVNLGLMNGGVPTSLIEDVGAPYFFPYREDFYTGATTNDLLSLSYECLRFSANLYRLIGMRSGRPVITRHLDRLPTGMTRSAQPVVEAIEDVLRMFF